MLRELSIADFAIIERSSFQLGSGLTALTGETGAGKSILLDALGAVLGARVGPDFIRTGARVARIEARFELDTLVITELTPRLEELGVVLEADCSLTLTREIHDTGRSVARLNGSMVTAGALSEIGARLVDIHGQSDHLSLLRATHQRDLLDDYAELRPLREQVAASVRTVRDLRSRVTALEAGSRDHMHRLDLLRFQVTEIEEAALQPGEDQDLTRQRDILQNIDRLRAAIVEAAEGISGENGDSAAALDFLRKSESAMAHAAAIDDSVLTMSEQITELVVLAEDVQRSLRSYLDTIDLDPAQLGQVEDRLEIIRGLERKYGGTIPDILNFAEQAKAELESLGGGAFDLEAVRRELDTAEHNLRDLAVRLSEQRSTAAAELGPAIEQVVADLRMGSTHLQVQVRQNKDENGLVLTDGNRVSFDESGIDEIEFLFAPNAGEQLRPLGRIASGGETARLTLAIKSILSEVDNTPTLVFDEIDVGVGARSGQVVDEKLWQLSRSHQVIVVTHLPQIAAYGDEHLRIVKEDVDGRTISTVHEVADELRIDEIAFMIDGVPATDESRANARVILERVAGVKAKLT